MVSLSYNKKHGKEQACELCEQKIEANQERRVEIRIGIKGVKKTVSHTDCHEIYEALIKTQEILNEAFRMDRSIGDWFPFNGESEDD